MTKEQQKYLFAALAAAGAGAVIWLFLKKGPVPPPPSEQAPKAEIVQSRYAAEGVSG